MSQPQRTVWWIVLVGGLLLCTVHALAYRNLFDGICIDDAYISFRYATHLGAGDGLVFNSGEHVEGYSNFLWVLILTPFTMFLDDISSIASWLGLALATSALLVAAHSLRGLLQAGSPAALALMLLLVGGSGYFAAWSISGLETGLHALLFISAWARLTWEEQHPRPAWPLAAVLFAALALSRPEGAVFGIVALAYLALTRRGPRAGSRPSLGRFAVVFFGIVLAYEAWRFTWFGVHLLPNSVQAKTGGGLHQLWRGLRYLGGNFLFPYLPLVGSVVMLRWHTRPPGALLGILMVLTYLALFTAAGGDWSWGRFFGPVMPLASVLFVCMLAHVLQRRQAPLGRATVTMLTLLAFAFATIAADLTSRQRTWRQWSTYAVADQERVALGKWLRDNLPEDTRIAAFAIGQLSYYSGFWVHDMLGITDAHIAGLRMRDMGRGVPGHEKYDAEYTLAVVKRDVIIGAELLPGMPSSGLFMSQYQNVAGFWTHHKVAMHQDFLRRAMQRYRTP